MCGLIQCNSCRSTQLHHCQVPLSNKCRCAHHQQCTLQAGCTSCPTNDVKAAGGTEKPVNSEDMASKYFRLVIPAQVTFVSTAMMWSPTSFTAINTGLLPCNNSMTQEFSMTISTDCVDNSAYCARLPNEYKITKKEILAFEINY